MGFLNKLFKLTDKKELKEKIDNGAQLLDVRTVEEFHAGHVEGSVHIPLSSLPNKFKTIQNNSSIIVVCESGARSAQAVRFLISNGFEAYNGGSWRSFA
ncbi:MAG: sulfurtransferase [Bacteroidetes bacterium GWD2_45_23]|nr:MAG: sulfurtransferase [Bacteroidetes bacterium GWC2_46_850]OFX79354.1 MAG: sulfurtransferase [Bacteroidetes bacterium GWC1_47_7]OFX87251.1 MAG: sulfurtransferase [Bacteroidetes bacterium GWD2_45_23]HAR38143.1 sulfurtransferase [Porphyromonadaceae bacterium]HBB01730.1 sulfurtransferase [Porphyromonadaceae bacterium]